MAYGYKKIKDVNNILIKVKTYYIFRFTLFSKNEIISVNIISFVSYVLKIYIVMG